MAEDSSDPPVQPSSTLPPYPEIILTAIQELNDKNGSNKSSISKQIESTYGELPQAHATLLTHHLNKMKQSGQLTLLKNNYLISDPNSPPRRGRGRPPKPKSADALTIPSGPPRPRGRPPKAVDPADASATLAVSPRPRGRPPKVVDPNAPPRPPKSASSGRGRGRPPKIAQTGGGVPSQAVITGVKRGRGRPPKVKTAVALVGV